MTDPRGDGYVDEIPYTYGYHTAMNPRLMQWTVARAGFQPPDVRSACELGFGRGVSLAIHGSLGTAQWQGTDFNPEHARSALALCEGCEPQPEIHADSFAEYFARADLPDFDFIALHAVWSWISRENRARLVAFIRQRLRPGGALYLSYNLLPGWQPMLALREQLVARAEVARQGGLPIGAAIRQAIVEIERLEPEHDVILHALKRRSVSYLAHEFFNRDWHPMAPEAVADELAAAGVRRICPTENAPSVTFRSEYWLRDATALDSTMQRAVLSRFEVLNESSVTMEPLVLREGWSDAAAGTAAMAASLRNARQVNRQLLALAERSAEPSVLACPATGGGLELGWVTLLFCSARGRGLEGPDAWADHAQQRLEALGQRPIDQGVVLEGGMMVRRFLRQAAARFAEQTLPRLRELRVLD
jgi:SAM-dependent methyltransferase